MRHWALPRFWYHYRSLPKYVQRLADQKFEILKKDEEHPSLHFKTMTWRKNLWSVRIGISYRAIDIERLDGIHWFWIGSHTEYDKLLS